MSTANLPSALSERRAWINRLTPEKKLLLNREFDRYSALAPEEKQALEQIDQYVQSEPERGEQLIRVMQRYHDWLITLTPTERANLSDAVPDKRLALVRQLKQDQENRLFARLGGPNAPQDLEAVLHWMQDFALAHEVEIMEALPDDKRQELKKLAQRGDDRGGKRLYQRRLAAELWQPNSSVKMPAISDADLQPLLAQLSPDKQQELKSKTDTADRVQILRSWIRSAMRAQWTQFVSQGGWRGMGGGGSGGGPGGGFNADRTKRFQDDLKHFEEQLSPEEKKQLDDLPPDQRQTELLKRFQKSRSPSGPRSGFGPRPPDEGMPGVMPDGPPPDGPPPDNRHPRDVPPPEGKEQTPAK